jgi:uncharacterized cupin superfamily protein
MPQTHLPSLPWEGQSSPRGTYLLQGTATVRAGHTVRTLSAGDAILHPPGEPHQIRNASASADLDLLVVADNAPVDYRHYPDSGKWALPYPRLIFHPIPADYWSGEE